MLHAASWNTEVKIDFVVFLFVSENVVEPIGAVICSIRPQHKTYITVGL
jgi:hypothetical protein